MNPFAKATVAVLVFAALLYIGWAKYYEFLTSGRRAPESARILNQLEREGVPNIQLEDLDGNTVRLSDHYGKLVIVNFWASWCEPCVTEFPSLMKLIQHYDGEVVLFAISADYELEDIYTFLSAFGADSPHLKVMWDMEQETARRFGTFKLPESYIVGRSGQLIRKIAGVDDWSSAEAFEYFDMLLQMGEDL